jgi:tRNA threonylcarbamoyladenosine biosynthesis protein TsaB
MNVLGLETSGLTGTIAVSCEGTIDQRELATEGRRHAQTLVAEIHDLLRAHGLKPAEIDAIAVSIGPGSFTGLRVGVVCAKTFAYATGCRVVAVDTLAAIAVQAPADLSPLWIVSDAQRGDFFSARYTRTPTGECHRNGDIRIVPGAACLTTLPAGEFVAGPATSRITGDDFATTIVRADWATRPTAAAVIQLAMSRLHAGDSDDPWTLSPLYIRPSAAEEKRTAAAG